MNPDPDPCSTCGRRRRLGKKSWNPGGRRWLSSARSTCWDRMNTTDGFTCSATATNASWKSPADLMAGAENSGAAGAGWEESGGTSSVSAAQLFFGRLRVDANASPKTKSIATRVPNFNQSRVRTCISVCAVYGVSILLLVIELGLVFRLGLVVFFRRPRPARVASGRVLG